MKTDWPENKLFLRGLTNFPRFDCIYEKLLVSWFSTLKFTSYSIQVYPLVRYNLAQSKRMVRYCNVIVTKKSLVGECRNRENTSKPNTELRNFNRIISVWFYCIPFVLPPTRSLSKVRVFGLILYHWYTPCDQNTTKNINYYSEFT